MGDAIIVHEGFKSDSKKKVKLERGLRGKVTTIDKIGDSLIAFDGVAVKQWVFKRNIHKLQADEAVALSCQWERILWLTYARCIASSVAST